MFWERTTYAIAQQLEGRTSWECAFFGICYILPNQHIFRKYIIFSLSEKCVLRPGDMASQVGFSPRAVVWRTLI